MFIDWKTGAYVPNPSGADDIEVVEDFCEDCESYECFCSRDGDVEYISPDEIAAQRADLANDDARLGL